MLQNIKQIDATQARNNLPTLMDKTYSKSQKFILRRRGIPMVVLVSIDEFRELAGEKRKEEEAEKLKRRRLKLAKKMNKMREKIGPIGITTAELVRMGRRDFGVDYGY